MGVPSRLGDRLVGHTYQLVGVQSGKNLSATASGDSTLSIADTPETLTDAKKQAWKFTQIDQSDTERPDLKAYVITNTDCKVLVAKDGTNAFSDESVEDAKSDSAARWILNTSDGAIYQLLNASAKQNIDVDAFDPKDGEYTLTYSVTDSEGASYTVKRVVTVKEKSEPTELTKPTEPTKPGDTVKPNKPDAGNKQPGLSKTGASVSGVFGAFAALLAVGAGAALAARRRREPRR
ncbi:immunoglobulin-like domain-containing protein [uncultured Bifidobacterium sp.]|uniref:immunoglobulin-like domain-containing protein n=1 Tax=uncultured Bifidobacterium sp. TaxID=165187 RepID=UPI00259037B6|nr:immunoglobulin-like domain-containing protein [uncultured Bifidobacterium sp.]